MSEETFTGASLVRFMREQIAGTTDVSERARLEQGLALVRYTDSLVSQGMEVEQAKQEARRKFPPLYEGHELRPDWESRLSGEREKWL